MTAALVWAMTRWHLDGLSVLAFDTLVCAFVILYMVQKLWRGGRRR